MVRPLGKLMKLILTRNSAKGWVSRSGHFESRCATGSPVVSSAFDIRKSVPTLMLIRYNNKIPCERQAGVVQAIQLEQIINQFLLASTIMSSEKKNQEVIYIVDIRLLLSPCREGKLFKSSISMKIEKEYGDV